MWAMIVYGVASFIIAGLLVMAFRKWFHMRVKCWFCHADLKVPFRMRNCWDCPHCDQYNGFTETGDYNKPIPAMYNDLGGGRSLFDDDDQLKSNSTGQRYTQLKQQQQRRYSPPVSEVSLDTSRNGLCEKCNKNQALKVRQLANFLPSCEELFDQELSAFRKRLEQIYALCSNCQDVLRVELSNQRSRFGIQPSTMNGWTSSARSKQQNGSSFDKFWTAVNTIKETPRDFEKMDSGWKMNILPSHRFWIQSCQLVQLALYSSLLIGDLRLASSWIDGYVKDSSLASKLPGLLSFNSEENSGLIALTSVALELIVMALKWRLNLRHSVWTLFFGAFTAALAAGVFDTSHDRSTSDESSANDDVVIDRKIFLRFVFDIAVLASCLTNVVFAGWNRGDSGTAAVKRIHPDRSPRDRSIKKKSMLDAPSDNGYHPTSQLYATPPRQRRDSASPGRVGTMLGSLSLGCSGNQKKRPSAQSSILAPARFQPPPSSTTTNSSPSSSSQQHQNHSPQSTFNEASYLWPNRFQNQYRRNMMNGNIDADDGVSIFSSVSQRLRHATARSESQDSQCTHHSNLAPSRSDGFWKMITCVVLLCSVSTNALVLYYLLVARGG